MRPLLLGLRHSVPAGIGRICPRQKAERARHGPLRLMSLQSKLPELGVGITYSSSIEPLLHSHPELFDVLEIEPQTTWQKTTGWALPYRQSEDVLEHLLTLPGRKLIHSV